MIRSAEQIGAFVKGLCDYIEMKRFGEPVIVHFGDSPRVAGYSMSQLIETSLISGHFVELDNSVYIDVFSCKQYYPYRTAQYCSDFSRRVHSMFTLAAGCRTGQGTSGNGLTE